MIRNGSSSTPGASSTEELSARLERSYQQIATVQVLSSALAAAITVDEVTQVVMEHTSILGASAGSLMLRVGENIEMGAYFGYSFAETSSWQTLPLLAPTPLSEAARTGERIALGSRQALAERYPQTATHVVREAAWLSLPLSSADAIQGVLGLRFQAGCLPSASEQDYLSLLAQQIGLALARARLYEQAREQAAFEQKLLAVLTHDLRTPLTAILLAASQLSPRDAVEESMLERLRRSSMRMGAIIQNVLAMASQRAAAKHPPSEPTDIDDLLGDLCDELRAAFPQREITLRSHVVRPLRLGATCLEQIVTNLARNALQHGDPGSPVTITAELVSDQLHLSVHNFGPEIPAGSRADLFEAFRRGEGARSRGTGLGLYIVRELCRSLHGSVELESADGQTVFRVEIPLPASVAGA